MEYKGYTAKVDLDSDANLFHGQVLDIRDVITFQGTSVDELWEEFQASVDDYLEWCEERGEEPDKPFSGRFVVRLSPELHRAVAVKASLDGMSLNSWVSHVLEKEISRVKQPKLHSVKTSGEQRTPASTTWNNTITGPQEIGGLKTQHSSRSQSNLARGTTIEGTIDSQGHEILN